VPTNRPHAARQALQGLADAAGVTLQLRVRRGAEPFAEIVQAARELPADLIVSAAAASAAAGQPAGG
jgi:nucleotide-binding universal stress UspA family protein